MTLATPPTEIADQASIAALLSQLSELKAQVKATRELLGPLEDGLEKAKREYQDRVGPHLRQISKLGTELAGLEVQIRALEESEEDTEPTDPVSEGGSDDGTLTPPPNEQALAPKEESVPSDQDKELLLVHAFRLLDSQVNPSDAALIGEIDGMVKNPAVTLADILERLPWGVVWEQANETEDLNAQCRRLSGWERALANQLASLKRGEELLKRDTRYPLWQRQQQGADAWRAYLAEAEQQLQGEIAPLELRRADRQAQLQALLDAR
jgi:hypothetical protein